MTRPAVLRSWSRARGLTTLLLLLALAAPGSARGKATAKQDKINVYVEILNTWSPAVFKAYDGYASWVDMKAGPTCKERGLRAPGALGDSAPARFAGYAKVIKKAPKLEVDAAVTRMVETLTALFAPTNEAAAYYQKRAYKDDACKRGQELHAQLVAGWQAYIEADRELRAFVGAHNNELATAALAAAKKKYGAKFRYHFEKLLIDGKAVIAEVDAQGAAATPDLAAIRGKVDTFAATLATASELTTAAKTDKKLHGDLYQGGYVQLVNQAAGLPRSTTRLLEVLASPPSKARERDLERAHKQVITDYNQLIGAANKTRFSARIK